MMYRRKLIALDYPQPEMFQLPNDNQLRSLVLWLEDQKIRHFKIEERAALRDIESSQWTTTFLQYLTELECPYLEGRMDIILDWLLRYAVRLEYGDDVEQYKTMDKNTFENFKSFQSGSSSNPLDNLNFDDGDFKAGVASLAILMQIPPYSDHVEQLKAIKILVNNTLTKDALKSSKKVNTTKIQDDHIPLEKTDLGFEAGDYIMNDAAKIIRLLHMKELRDLQTKINEAIVAVQAVTADPKTDNRLGKVGY